MYVIHGLRFTSPKNKTLLILTTSSVDFSPHYSDYMKTVIFSTTIGFHMQITWYIQPLYRSTLVTIFLLVYDTHRIQLLAYILKTISSLVSFSFGSMRYCLCVAVCTGRYSAVLYSTTIHNQLIFKNLNLYHFQIL